MITLNAKINIVKEQDASLTSATNEVLGTSTKNNLSGVLGSIKENDYFIGSNNCNQYGIFTKANLITIKGSKIKSLSVAFDDVNNQFPKTIKFPKFAEISKQVSVSSGGTTTNRIYDFDVDFGVPVISVEITGRVHKGVTGTITPNYSLITINEDRTIVNIYEIMGSLGGTIMYTIVATVLDEEGTQEIYNYSPIANIVLKEEASEISFLIDDWNTPNSPMVIKGIYLPSRVDYYIKNINMRGVSSTIRDRKDEELPSYGVVANSGSLEFVDYDDTIDNYISNNIVGENMRVQIILLNTLTNKKEIVGDLYTEKWDYDDDDRKVSVSLVDDLIEWQNIKFLGMSLKNTMSVYDLCEYLRGITPSKFEFEEIDEETTSYMQSVKCNNPYIEEGSLWSAYDKLCQIGSLHIYKNNNKVIVKHLI